MEKKHMKSVKEINAIITKLVNEVKAYEDQGSKLLDEAKALYNSWRGTTSRVPRTTARC